MGLIKDDLTFFDCVENRYDFFKNKISKIDPICEIIITSNKYVSWYNFEKNSKISKMSKKDLLNAIKNINQNYIHFGLIKNYNIFLLKLILKFKGIFKINFNNKYSNLAQNKELLFESTSNVKYFRKFATLTPFVRILCICHQIFSNLIDWSF